MSEEGDIASNRAHARKHAIRTHSYVRNRLAARATVDEWIPARPLGANLRGAPAFVRAVVPLHQIIVRCETIGEARELCGAPRARERAAPNFGELQRLQLRAQRPRVPLAVL